MGIEEMEIEIIATDNVADFKELISLFAQVFEMENFVAPDTGHLSTLLQKEGFMAIAAKADQKIIGGLTVYVIDRYYSANPLAYVYDLAVLNEYQRKGLGKRLMKFVTDYCREKGFEEVFVQAEKEDDHAVDFYRKTNPGRAEDVMHFTYTLK